MWIFCPIPQEFRRFLFEPENKSPGVSPGSTPGKANDKCITFFNTVDKIADEFTLCKLAYKREANDF